MENYESNIGLILREGARLRDELAQFKAEREKCLADIKTGEDDISRVADELEGMRKALTARKGDLTTLDSRIAEKERASNEIVKAFTGSRGGEAHVTSTDPAPTTEPDIPSSDEKANTTTKQDEFQRLSALIKEKGIPENFELNKQTLKLFALSCAKCGANASRANGFFREERGVHGHFGAVHGNDETISKSKRCHREEWDADRLQKLISEDIQYLPIYGDGKATTKASVETTRQTPNNTNILRVSLSNSNAASDQKGDQRHDNTPSQEPTQPSANPSRSFTTPDVSANAGDIIEGAGMRLLAENALGRDAVSTQWRPSNHIIPDGSPAPSRESSPGSIAKSLFEGELNVSPRQQSATPECPSETGGKKRKREPSIGLFVSPAASPSESAKMTGHESVPTAYSSIDGSAPSVQTRSQGNAEKKSKTTGDSRDDGALPSDEERSLFLYKPAQIPVATIARDYKMDDILQTIESLFGGAHVLNTVREEQRHFKCTFKTVEDAAQANGMIIRLSSGRTPTLYSHREGTKLLKLKDCGFHMWTVVLEALRQWIHPSNSFVVYQRASNGAPASGYWVELLRPVPRRGCLFLNRHGRVGIDAVGKRSAGKEWVAIEVPKTPCDGCGESHPFQVCPHAVQVFP